uniref:Uncharacterized protein n=1 Tax=Alexandrium catenella TaxID=2925 RepID=A0A7S1L072_ALECA
MALKRKLEAVLPVAPEDEEERKRKKKEAAAAFFVQAKEKKDAEKRERAEAIARGEAVPEKEAPPPLSEPPALAPEVRAFTAAAGDPGVPLESLHALYQRIVSVRGEIATAADGISNREDATVQMRRKALLRVVVDRLRCVEDQTLPLAGMAADPAVAALKKGLTKSLLAFAGGYPDSFKITELPNSKGNATQYITLAGSGPKGTGADVANGTAGAEKLLGQIHTTLQACGGSSTVEALGRDQQVRERMKGVASRLSKFLAHYPEAFELAQTADGKDVFVNLKGAAPAGQGQFSLAAPQAGLNQGPALGDPKELLLEAVLSHLQERGGTATISELAQEPTVKQRQHGVAAKLSKFLAQYPTHFLVQAEGPQQILTCHLVAN